MCARPRRAKASSVSMPPGSSNARGAPPNCRDRIADLAVCGEPCSLRPKDRPSPSTAPASIARPKFGRGLVERISCRQWRPLGGEPDNARPGATANGSAELLCGGCAAQCACVAHKPRRTRRWLGVGDSATATCSYFSGKEWRHLFPPGPGLPCKARFRKASSTARGQVWLPFAKGSTWKQKEKWETARGASAAKLHLGRRQDRLWRLRARASPSSTWPCLNTTRARWAHSAGINTGRDRVRPASSGTRDNAKC